MSNQGGIFEYTFSRLNAHKALLNKLSLTITIYKDRFKVKDHEIVDTFNLAILLFYLQERLCAS